MGRSLTRLNMRIAKQVVYAMKVMPIIKETIPRENVSGRPFVTRVCRSMLIQRLFYPTQISADLTHFHGRSEVNRLLIVALIESAEFLSYFLTGSSEMSESVLLCMIDRMVIFNFTSPLVWHFCNTSALESLKQTATLTKVENKTQTKNSNNIHKYGFLPKSPKRTSFAKR